MALVSEGSGGSEEEGPSNDGKDEGEAEEEEGVAVEVGAVGRGERVWFEGFGFKGGHNEETDCLDAVRSCRSGLFHQHEGCKFME